MESNIIPIIKKSSRPYRNLGKRVQNIHTGIMGTITEAERRTNVKSGWKIRITYDDGHKGILWTDRDTLNHNRIVADDFVPDYGPVRERILALIARIDRGGLEWQYGHSTEGRCNRDVVMIWKPLTTFETIASLYGGQGKWEAEGRTQDEAWAKLRCMLTEAAASLDSERRGCDARRERRRP
jgi:hypothetical protein